MKYSVVFTLAANSLEAMFRVFIVCCVGFYAATHPKDKPLLSKQALQVISKLSTYIFIPCLTMSSLGSALNFHLFSQIGFLVICCPIVTLTSYLLSRTVGQLFVKSNNDKWYSVLCIATSFPNTINLPIMIMQTMCDINVINADYDNDSIQCNNAANGMLFLYSVGFHSIYWTFAVHRLNSAAETISKQSETETGKLLNAIKHVLSTPAVIGVIVGVCIGLFQPVRALLFDKDSAFYSFGSSMITLGQPVVAIQTLVMAASLGQLDLKSIKGSSSWCTFSSICKDHKGAETNLELGKYSKVNQDEDQSEGEIEGERLPAPLQGVVSDSPEQKVVVPVAELEPATSGSQELPSVAEVLMMVLIRLVLTPLVLVPIILWIAKHYFLTDPSAALSSQFRLLFLMLCIESGSGSAQVILVTLNEIGNYKIASKLAYLYFFQYLLCVLTIPLWSTLSLYILYY